MRPLPGTAPAPAAVAAPAASASKYKVGDNVVAQFSEDQVWYVGKVDAVHDNGSYKITYTEYGNTEDRTEEFIRPWVDWKVGDKLEAQFSEDLVWYAAEITGPSADGKGFHVRYTEYGNEEDTKPEFMRRLPSAEGTSGPSKWVISIRMSAASQSTTSSLQVPERQHPADTAAIRTAVEATLERRIPSASICAICYKSYADIAATAASSAVGLTAVLPCCHTVCRNCVRICAETRSVACPVCAERFDAITTVALVDALPRDAFIEDGVHAGEHIQCSDCIADEMTCIAVARCERCAKDLCDAHALIHKRHP